MRNNKHPKLIRVTTVPISLGKLLKGQMRFMRESGYEVIGVSSPGETLDRVGKSEGIRVVPIDMSRQITPLQDLKSLCEVYRLMRKEKPHIVHTHTPKAGIVGMMAAWLARVPVRLHTVAGLPLMEASGTKRVILDWVEKFTYFFATKVYPNSHGLYQFIVDEKLCKPEKLNVIAGGSSNGIDTSHFNPALFSEDQNSRLRSELNIAEDDLVFVFVGRMVKDKGVNELVAAFSRVTSFEFRVSSKIRNQQLDVSSNDYRDTHDVRTTFSPPLGEPEGAFSGELEGASYPSPLVTEFIEVGGRWMGAKLLLVGPYEQELDPVLPETKKSIEENPNIIHVGYQEDVRPFLAVADCLAFPSYREGFPNVVMQAGAMGLPSIVTDINGCNEIIIEGENGMIIPPKDEDALYQAMMKMVDDIENRDRMALKSREMICNRYEQKVVWEALLEEYKRVMK